MLRSKVNSLGNPDDQSWRKKEGYGGKDLQKSKVLSLEWRSEGLPGSLKQVESTSQTASRPSLSGSSGVKMGWLLRLVTGAPLVVGQF